MEIDDSDPVSYGPHVLRDYALLADGERGSLIGPRGDYAWMCAPRWDSDAVWSALLGGPGVIRDPHRPSARVGRSLDNGQPDLGGTLGHHRPARRMPGGAGVSRRSPPVVVLRRSSRSTATPKSG